MNLLQKNVPFLGHIILALLPELIKLLVLCFCSISLLILLLLYSISELIEHERNGLIFEDSQQLSEQIQVSVHKNFVLLEQEIRIHVYQVWQS